jgi:two-component system CheB/CheR fusion protein
MMDSQDIFEKQAYKYAAELSEALRFEMKMRKELENVNKDLVQSNDELQQFSFIASHDLKEPLRKISIFSDLLELEKDNLNGKTLYYLNCLQKSALRMNSLIDDLLLFSRVSIRDFNISPVNLTQLVTRILEDLDQKPDTSIYITNLPVIETSEFHLHQIFLNLLSNAFKFSSDTKNLVININCTSIEDKDWEITVSDNGVGIDEKYFDKIFKLCQHLNGRGQFESTGMGLAICRTAIKYCRGTIDVQSTLDKGSTFIIKLPKNIKTNKN